MSEKYLPLFRKYRPQTFCDLVGQENLVKALTNAIELNRIAPAYLFCGPRGTGKTSSARIFAKSLNCEKGPTVNPCQKCASCIDITNAAGMDVIEIDAATNRGVEGAEDLIAQVHYAPVSGKYKIFIIDEVHMLTSTAFNALLKTFEEPPENVVFILATTEPHKVLETIVSRCQRFDFRRITVDDIVKRLKEISQIEKIKITDDALFTIAKNVSGGLRDSLALLDQVSILGAREEITKETIEELLGKVTFDKLLALLDNIVSSDIENSLKLVDEIYTKGSEPRNLCENFLEFLRNVIIILNAKNPHDVIKFTSLSSVDVDKVLEKKYNPKLCQKILGIVIEYYKEVKFATNPYLWVELTIICASRANEILEAPPVGEAVQVQKNAAQMQGIKQVSAESLKASSVPAKNAPITNEIKNEVRQSNETSEPVLDVNNLNKEEQDKQNIEAAVFDDAKSAVCNTENLVEIWSNIVNSIESVPAKFFYSGMAKLVELDDNRIILGFINHNVIAQAKSELKHKALIDAEQKVYGGRYSFEFVQLGGNIKPLEGADIKPVVKQQPKAEQKAQQKTDPSSSYSQSTPDSASNGAEDTQNTIEDSKNAYSNQTPNEENGLNQALYSPKVKEMLEAFGGRIVE